MKKTLLLCLMMLGAATAAPVKPADALALSAEARQAACDAGFARGENPRLSGDEFLKYVYGLASGVEIQLPGGSVFKSCSGDAEALKPKKVFADYVVVLDIGGTTTSSPSDTKSWAMALVISDAAGKELNRLSPVVENEGVPSNWKVNCSTTPCVWSGANTYIFAIRAASQELLRRLTDPPAATLTVLVSRGNGVERYVLDSDMQGKPTF